MCICAVSELAQGTGLLANGIAMLGSSEEHTALARVLGQLAEVEERCDNVHVDQSYADFFVFAELVHEYVGLVQAVKVCSDSCNRTPLRYSYYRKQQRRSRDVVLETIFLQPWS